MLWYFILYSRIYGNIPYVGDVYVILISVSGKIGGDTPSVEMYGFVPALNGGKKTTFGDPVSGKAKHAEFV